MVRCALFASERHPEVRALCAPRRMRGREWPVSFEARFSLAPQDDGGDTGARSVIPRMRRDVTRSHRSFTMFGDARPSPREVAPNQPQSIRAKIRVWRVKMRRRGSARKNFFIAKIHDSESAQAQFGRVSHVSRCRSRNDRRCRE
jgi:hypothetical protein